MVYTEHVFTSVYDTNVVPLQRFFNEAQDHHGDYEDLEAESEKWAEHLIPEEFQENLMSPSEPSPPPFAGNGHDVIVNYTVMIIWEVV